MLRPTRGYCGTFLCPFFLGKQPFRHRGVVKKGPGDVIEIVDGDELVGAGVDGLHLVEFLGHVDFGVSL